MMDTRESANHSSPMLDAYVERRKKLGDGDDNVNEELEDGDPNNKGNDDLGYRTDDPEDGDSNIATDNWGMVMIITAMKMIYCQKISHPLNPHYLDLHSNYSQLTYINAFK